MKTSLQPQQATFDHIQMNATNSAAVANDPSSISMSDQSVQRRMSSTLPSHLTDTLSSTADMLAVKSVFTLANDEASPADKLRTQGFCVFKNTLPSSFVDQLLDPSGIILKKQDEEYNKAFNTIGSLFDILESEDYIELIDSHAITSIFNDLGFKVPIRNTIQ